MSIKLKAGAAVLSSNVSTSGIGAKRQVMIEHVFKARKDILVDKSKFFKAKFRVKGFGEIEKNAGPLLEYPNANAFEVVVRVLHDTVLENQEVSLADIWNIAEICNQYLIDLALFQNWYAAWFDSKFPAVLKEDMGRHLVENAKRDDYNSREPCDLRKLLFPTYVFSYAKAFLFLTQHVVYDSQDHIIEDNPTLLFHLHLEARVMSKFSLDVSSA